MKGIFVYLISLETQNMCNTSQAKPYNLYKYFNIHVGDEIRLLHLHSGADRDGGPGRIASHSLLPPVPQQDDPGFTCAQFHPCSSYTHDSEGNYTYL